MDSVIEEKQKGKLYCFSNYVAQSACFINFQAKASIQDDRTYPWSMLETLNNNLNSVNSRQHQASNCSLKSHKVKQKPSFFTKSND